MSVLIIEDTEADMELMTYVLKKYSVKYFCAETVEESFQVLEKNKDIIRVICLDLSLGRDHGFEFLEWRSLSPEYSKIPVIVTTTYADLKTIRIALIKGAKDFIIKPLEMEIFVDRLKELGVIPPDREEVKK